LKDHQYRGKREQVELWAKNSGEAIKWMLDLATAEGAQVSDTTMKWTAAIKEVNGYPVDYLSIDFGPKPYNTCDGMQVLADYAAAQGVEIFYNTEAKQLVGDAAGVTGVIAEGPDGTVQFNAAKGVILATGDYQNDDDMMAYYLPDLANLGRKQMNKTGDGHKMAVWAGGAIEDITHTKMLHDFDGGPGSTGTTGHLRMEGRDVFRFAVGQVTDVIADAFDKAGLTASDLDWFVPHQANRRIIEASADKLGIAREKIVLTVDRHGNTSAASIPLALDVAVRDGRIKPGDLVMIEAIGGGFSWGAALIRW